MKGLFLRMMVASRFMKTALVHERRRGCSVCTSARLCVRVRACSCQRRVPLPFVRAACKFTLTNTAQLSLRRLWATRNTIKISSRDLGGCVKNCFVYWSLLNAPQRGFMCGSVFFVLSSLETVCVSCSLLNATLFFPCCGSTCHFSLLPVDERTHTHTHIHTRAQKNEECLFHTWQ